MWVCWKIPHLWKKIRVRIICGCTLYMGIYGMLKLVGPDQHHGHVVMLGWGSLSWPLASSSFLSFTEVFRALMNNKGWKVHMAFVLVPQSHLFLWWIHLSYQCWYRPPTVYFVSRQGVFHTCMVWYGRVNITIIHRRGGGGHILHSPTTKISLMCVESYGDTRACGGVHTHSHCKTSVLLDNEIIPTKVKAHFFQSAKGATSSDKMWNLLKQLDLQGFLCEIYIPFFWKWCSMDKTRHRFI